MQDRPRWCPQGIKHGPRRDIKVGPVDGSIVAGPTETEALVEEEQVLVYLIVSPILTVSNIRCILYCYCH